MKFAMMESVNGENGFIKSQFYNYAYKTKSKKCKSLQKTICSENRIRFIASLLNIAPCIIDTKIDGMLLVIEENLIVFPFYPTGNFLN